MILFRNLPLLLLIVAVLGFYPAALKAKEILISAEPAQFHKFDKDIADIGKFQFLSAHILDSNYGGFGGWSGLAVSDDLQELYMISDRGYLLVADMNFISKELLGKYSLESPQKGFQADIFKLKDYDGKYLNKIRSDSESIIYDAEQDSLLISFERRERIDKYIINQDNTLSKAKNYHHLSEKFLKQENFQYNEGFESLAKINDELIVIAETDFVVEDLLKQDARFASAYHNSTKKHDKYSKGWQCPYDADYNSASAGKTKLDNDNNKNKSHQKASENCNTIYYPLDDGYGLVEINEYPAGGMLALERKFDAINMIFGTSPLFNRLYYFPQEAVSDLKNSSIIDKSKAVALLPLEFPYISGNFEAIDIFEYQGQQILVMINDDNYNKGYNTFLMFLALKEPLGQAKHQNN